MRKLLATICIAAWVTAAGAAEVGGVKLPDTANVAGSDLVLNGAGIRTRAIFKVYVGSLYLSKKTADAAAAIGEQAPKRVQINMLRTVSADDFVGALNDGLKANNSEAELAAVKAQVDQLQSIMKSFGEAKDGGVVTLDYVPGQGTVVSYEGKARGTIPGDAFNKALMKIWLGDKPIQGDLKKAMLGG
jgi:long-chain acyl-CoA synthetase